MRNYKFYKSANNYLENELSKNCSKVIFYNLIRA